MLKVLRTSALLFVVGVVVASGWTLLAGSTNPTLPGHELGPGPGPGSGGNAKGGFQPCPVPACMAPCVFPPPPQVTCKSGKSTFVTSFACCCCGGSGNSFKPL
jgi:hypothetical protein